MTGDHYHRLEVAPHARPSVITAAYRVLSKELHPDVTGTPETTMEMAALNVAYEVLSDPAERAAYDARQEAVRRPPPPPPGSGERMPFGKHRGQPLALVPLAYLLWCRDNVTSLSHRRVVLAELARRGYG